MTLNEYFQQSSSPMEHSPAGEQMLRVLRKFPNLDFESARQKAKELLFVAAARTNYQIPTVLTDAERVAQLEKLRIFAASKKAA